MNYEKIRKEFNKYWWDKDWLKQRIVDLEDYRKQYNPDASARDKEIWESATGILENTKEQLIKVNSLI